MAIENSKYNPEVQLGEIRKYTERLESLFNELSGQIEYYENGLYQEVQSLKKGNLHEQKMAGELEKEYWEAKAQGVVSEYSEKCNTILNLLTQIEQGEVDIQGINSILGENVQVDSHLSKRKQRITEIKNRYGYDPRGDAVRDGFSVSDPRRITKGGSKTGIKAGSTGGIDSYSAEGEFYNQTSRTHGGKARHSPGKGKTYVSKDGKRVRKK